MYKLDKNERFSEMSINDKNELLSFLKHYHIEYRHKIGLNPDMTFGIEIECSTSGKRIFHYKHRKYTNFFLELVLGCRKRILNSLAR